MRLSVRLSALLIPVATVLAAPAQQTVRPFRIAIVANTVPLLEWSAPTTSEETPHAGHAIREGLQKLGWVDGKNIEILWRSAEGRLDRLPAIFDELVKVPADVIVAIGPGSQAAARATRSIPIVIASSAGGLGRLVDSLSRPGRNITGVTFEALGLETKRLETLKRAAPASKRVAVLMEQGACPNASKEMDTAAATMGLTLIPVSFASLEDAERGLTDARARGAEAILVCDGVMVYRRGFQRAINEIAVRHRLPIMHTATGGADTGGLLAYGIDTMVQYRRVPYFVDRILRGAKAEDLPIEQPTSVQLVVNTKVAKALGLTLPPAVLLQADRVVE